MDFLFYYINDSGHWFLINQPITMAFVRYKAIMSVLLNLAASEARLVGETLKRYDIVGRETYFSVPPGNGKNYYIPPPSIAQFKFNVPKADKYAVWVLIKSPTTENQGYYIYDGKGRWFTWLAGIHSDWSWVKISDSVTYAPIAFDFVKGINEFQMGWCDEDVKVDQVIVTNDFDYVPNGSTTSSPLSA
jgi:hypothetical protein